MESWAADPVDQLLPQLVDTSDSKEGWTQTGCGLQLCDCITRIFVWADSHPLTAFVVQAQTITGPQPRLDSLDSLQGGFVYCTFRGGTVDLSGLDGLLFEFDTMDAAVYGAAPVAFNIELESNEYCSLTAAFAVPTTAVVERASAWVPLLRFKPKGRHWDYRVSSDTPAACTGRTARLSSISQFAVGVYYQPTPFLLSLSAVEARASKPTQVTPPAAVGAATLLRHAAARARELRSKAGAGVGSEQMDAMAAAALETAVIQTADAGLLALVNSSALFSSADRVTQLLSAVDATISTAPSTGTSPSVQTVPFVADGGGDGSSAPSLPPPSGSSALSPTLIAIIAAAGATLALAVTICALGRRNGRWRCAPTPPEGLAKTVMTTTAVAVISNIAPTPTTIQVQGIEHSHSEPTSLPPSPPGSCRAVPPHVV